MKINEYFDKLTLGSIGLNDYLSLRRQCLRLVRKACGNYKLDDIVTNNVVKQEVLDNILIKSLLKSIVGYKSDKGAFTTYFYYKALSAARVEIGKLKRRTSLVTLYRLTNYN